MSRWDPLQQRYGFGVARIPLSPPSVARSRESVPLLAGLRAIRAERAPGDTRRACLRALPPMLAGVVVTLLLAMFTQPNEDTTIVPFAEVPPPTAPVELAQTPPPPEPEPEPPPEAAPEPPAPLLAQTPPPAQAPPPEPEVAEPPPARPRPSLPALALAEPAPPPPTPARARPRSTPRPAPAMRPELAPERLAAERTPAPVEHRRSAKQFAEARSRTPRPALQAAAALPAARAPAAQSPSRRARPAPRAEPTSRPRSPAALQAPGSGLPAQDDSPAPSRRGSRSVASARTPSRRPRPSLSGPSAPQAHNAPPSPRGTRRAPARVAAPTAPASGRQSGTREGLSGVPLASLAACVTDAKEQALKQRILAAVGSRRSCRSTVGRYHFVETKNLNAFLMRIERASGRRVGDRCAELTYALDCLSR